jgi:hypothetical protein
MTVIATVVVISVTTFTGYTQSFTIPEMAAASGDKTVTMTMMEEERVVPLAELSTASDLVIDARLVRPRSYLSDDKTMIYTDYEIVPSRVLRSRISDGSQKPGPQLPLLLTVHGGEITLEGKTITLSSGKLKPIRTGGRFLGAC